MSLYSIDKVFLPKTNGRPAKQPTWRVIGWGTGRFFHRKRDAESYIVEQQAKERAGDKR